MDEETKQQDQPEIEDELSAPKGRLPWMRKPDIGEIIEVEITDAAYGGDGVGRFNGLVVMVRGALPGDKIEAVVIKRKKHHVEAKIEKLIGAAQHRVEAECRHYAYCGGCSWQHLDYAHQLVAKENQVREHLRRIGGVEEPNILPIIGMESPWRYRNKMEYAFYAMNDGGIRLGLHSRGRYDYVIDIDDCLLQPVNCNEIRNFTREFFRSRNAVAFHTKHHTGNLRHLVFRTARGAKSVMAAIICAEGTFPDEDIFVAELAAAFPEIESVMKFHNTSKGGAAVAGAATGLYGSECITEEILGIKLEVSAGSFMQTNTTQAELLYSTLMEMCEIEGHETLLDLYTGAGPIALLAAKKAERVIGIESVESSIADARRNAALNEISNVEFVCGEVEKLLGDIINETKPAAVIVDPPRPGLHKKAVAAIIEAAPERLMYVSCNPSTLARDTVDFVAGGYTLDAVRPVDMFPHTYHIECVARFTKK